MAETVFKTGRFTGFSVHGTRSAVAANKETIVVFNLGAIPGPIN